MEGSLDFTLDLPSIDYDLVADWLCEPGPELPLTIDDVRQLYSGSESTPSPEELKKHSSLPPPSVPSSIHTSIPFSAPPSVISFPPHQSRPVSAAISAHESLWDDSDDDESVSVYSQPEHIAHIRLPQLARHVDQRGDQRIEENDSSDDDEDDSGSDTTTLHNVPTSLSPAAAATAFATGNPHDHHDTHNFRYPFDLLRTIAYGFVDTEFLKVLDSLDEGLLKSPATVFGDVLYTSTVRPDPLSGAHGISPHSSDLDRVSERTEDPEEEAEEESSEESEDDDDSDTVELKFKFNGSELSLPPPPRTLPPLPPPLAHMQGRERSCVTPTQSRWSPWMEKPREPVEVVTQISLPPALLASSETERMKMRSLEPEDRSSSPPPSQFTYLFLKAPRPQRDSHPIGGFPTRLEPLEPQTRRIGNVKHIIMRGLNLGWRDRVHYS
ncbi:hypothetical protein NLI96_g12194 [Meripilus lineatus]|uniref:Uncharacterized protein n=1 Tax=Meripilus lineatus TaxID=2056292 RepID=A0AAD5UQI6_9APHY|nr:hypothetical protein NLI96_g12194 [Physisporinus lineatus]